MKNEKDLELTRLEKRQPLGIILDGDDLGTFTYNPETKRYEGKTIGCIEIGKMLDAIKGNIEFIKVVIPNE